MNKFHWTASARGYQSSAFNEKYLLDVWQDGGEWSAVVNRRKVTDDLGHPRKFSLPESAQVAAEELALEMMRGDGVGDDSED